MRSGAAARPPTVGSVLVAALLVAGCSAEVTRPEPQVVEEIPYAPGLGVDLGAMTRTGSGLYFLELEEGEGPPAEQGDSVRVRFAGFLNTGQNFGAGDLEPFVLGSGAYIPGFEEAVEGMRVGGIRKAVLPPELGYGEDGSGSVPGGAVLVFDLALLDRVEGPF